MSCFDPLEETVAADDITGRNNCPMYLRITALWAKYEQQGCWTFQNGGALKEGFRAQERVKKERKSQKIKCWVEIDGAIIWVDSIKDIPERVNRSIRQVENAKALAVKLGKTETVTEGVRWGWAFAKKALNNP